MSDTLLRLKQYIDYKGFSLRSFEQSIGVSNGSFTSQLKNGKTTGVDKLENILRIYEELNPDWVLTGKGNMLREEASVPNQESYILELYEVNKKYSLLLEEKLKATEDQLKISSEELEKLRKEK